MRLATGRSNIAFGGDLTVSVPYVLVVVCRCGALIRFYDFISSLSSLLALCLFSALLAASVRKMRLATSRSQFAYGEGVNAENSRVGDIETHRALRAAEASISLVVLLGSYCLCCRHYLGRDMGRVSPESQGDIRRNNNDRLVFIENVF